MTFTDVMRQMVEQALNSAVISSAGGDSPKRNFVMSIDINSADFEGILEDSIRNIVNESLEERELAYTPTAKEKSKSTNPAEQALSFLGGKLGASPQSIVASLAPVLGPAIIVLMLPKILEFVLQELTKPGGVFDTRFRRELQKEQFGFYDRQLQYDSRYGHRNVIIQGVNGFKREQGAFHASTFRDITEGTGEGFRLSRIGLTDKAYGFRDY